MRGRDNRLAPSAAQRRRWARLPGFQPHADTVRVEHDSWSDRPAVYHHVTPEAVDALRRAAERDLLVVWTVDPNAPRPGEVHLNRYTLTVAQALELIAGCASGRWIEQVLHIEPLSDAEQAEARAAPSDEHRPVGSQERAMEGIVEAVHRSPGHTLRKPSVPAVVLVEGLGVEGDAHQGSTVQHRSRVARDPHQPNLRQVHLIHAELHDELRDRGFAVYAGEMGENITTRGIDLLALPAGTRLHLGAEAVVEITGLRNPCTQLDGLQQGLMAAVLDRDAYGALVRKAGIMGIVVQGGPVQPRDPIHVTPPPEPHRPLEPV